MNYFNIPLRIVTGFLTFAIGLALVGSPVSEKPLRKHPGPEQTRTDALDAELEATNAFFRLIEADRKAQKTRESEEITDEDSFYAPEGDFEIILGNLGELKKVTGFYLATSEYDEKKELLFQIAPKGAITDADIEYPMNNIFVSPHYVSFTTNSVRGISFRFTGNVAVRKYKEDYGATVITGTLVKTRDGKALIEQVVEFEELLGC